MWYVYILESEGEEGRYYIGCAGDLKLRLQQHNSGEVLHTAKYLPWKLKSYTAFSDRHKAYAFEKYLKSGSGRTFVKKHF